MRCIRYSVKRRLQQRTHGETRRAFLQRTALALASLAGGLPARAVGSAGGAVLHIRNYVDVSSLDPLSTLSYAEGLVNAAIQRNLLQFKADGSWEVQPDAAEHFDQLDATRYGFRLKPGQMFNGGFGEMTADDVKFSFERMVDPAMGSLNAPDMGPLDHVEVHDRYSGTFVLRSPFAAFVPVAVAGPNGVILSRKAVAAVGGRFTTRPPCSSGPYAFKSWQAQRKTVLERNPAWTGRPGAFAEIHVYAMTDDKAGELAFEAGQLDCSQISVESVEPFRSAMPTGSSLRVLPSGRNYWLGMNRENPALADIRVRQAIQWATDVDAVLEAAWFGLARVSTGPIPEGMTGHRAQAVIPARGDLGRARALLEEAGVALPLRLTLHVTARARDLTTAQVIQWSLKKAGIEVDIRAEDNSTFLTVGREDLGGRWRDLQLFLQDFVGLADPYYSMTWFTRSQKGLWNWERFSDAEFDRLHDYALETSDEAERGRAYERMQALMEESGCYRFLTNGVMPQIYRNSIRPAFRPDGYAILRAFRPDAGRT
jgi:peptide/nickel transport system substrate-binding protein